MRRGGKALDLRRRSDARGGDDQQGERRFRQAAGIGANRLRPRGLGRDARWRHPSRQVGRSQESKLDGYFMRQASEMCSILEGELGLSPAKRGRVGKVTRTARKLPPAAN